MRNKTVKKFGSTLHVILPTNEFKEGDEVTIVKSGGGIPTYLESDIIDALNSKVVLRTLKAQLEEDLKAYLDSKFAEVNSPREECQP